MIGCSKSCGIEDGERRWEHWSVNKVAVFEIICLHAICAPSDALDMMTINYHSKTTLDFFNPMFRSAIEAVLSGGSLERRLHVSPTWSQRHLLNTGVIPKLRGDVSHRIFECSNMTGEASRSRKRALGSVTRYYQGLIITVVCEVVGLKLRRLRQSFMCRLQDSPLCMICIRECAFIEGLVLLNG